MNQIVINGDNIEVLKTYPDNYFDAVVTDPPYGLGKEPDAVELMKNWIEHGYHEIKGSGFMGKEWDAFVPQPKFWKEVFRVLKHGGHVVSFFGTRTYDWGVMAMRFAGFEVRDCIQWLYGSGFPKSHNISKAIDKMYGAEREIVGEKITGNAKKNTSKTGEFADGLHGGQQIVSITKSATEEAKQWDGWGSALKPAHEDLVLARKPFQFRSDFVYLYENIVHNLKVQICQSKLFVKDAKEIFTLSQKESKGEGLDFAQWSVGKPFNIREDLFVLMDMLQLELKEENSTLNIVLSWLNILEELWNVANTYTIETESSTITELRILNSLEWESIFQNIILLKDKKIDGLIANVLTAESLFSVLNLKLNDIQTHFAKENAISKVEGKDFVPNSEQIVLARKPLEKGLSIAENVLKWGTGGINIDGCRVTTDEKIENHSRGEESAISKGKYGDSKEQETHQTEGQKLGRFPANIILTHHPECECKGLKKVKGSSCKPEDVGKGRDGDFSNGIYGDKQSKVTISHTDSDGMEEVEDWDCHEDCPIRIMDEQSGIIKTGDVKPYQNKSESTIYGNGKGYHIETKENYFKGDTGGASRFFYCAKASKSERNKGLEGFVNGHPTIKPVKLMQYLVRLITPPNGKVLDPFCGSGTTGIACKLEGFEFVGIEQDPEYTKIAEARINNWVEEKEEPKKESKSKEPKEEKKTLIQQNLF